MGIVGYEESEWSDPVNITVTNESQDNSTVYFGSELQITSASTSDNNTSTGGGWIIENQGNLLLFIAILILFPLAIFVKFGLNGKVVKWRK